MVRALGFRQRLGALSAVQQEGGPGAQALASSQKKLRHRGLRSCREGCSHTEDHGQPHYGLWRVRLRCWLLYNQRGPVTRPAWPPLFAAADQWVAAVRVVRERLLDLRWRRVIHMIDDAAKDTKRCDVRAHDIEAVVHGTTRVTGCIPVSIVFFVRARRFQQWQHGEDAGLRGVILTSMSVAQT